MNEVELKKLILKSVAKTLRVKKTDDLVGNEFRHEHFAISLSLPRILEFGAAGTDFEKRALVVADCEIETLKKDLTEDVQQIHEGGKIDIWHVAQKSA